MMVIIIYLSRENIATIAVRILRKCQSITVPRYESIGRIDPVKIATGILGLTVETMHLYPNDSILGVTS